MEKILKVSSAAALEYACKHFGVEKVIHITANGYDLKTHEYSIPECYINTTSFITAADMLSEFTDSGAHKESILLYHDIVKALQNQ